MPQLFSQIGRHRGHLFAKFEAFWSVTKSGPFGAGSCKAGCSVEVVQLCDYYVYCLPMKKFPALLSEKPCYYIQMVKKDDIDRPIANPYALLRST